VNQKRIQRVRSRVGEAIVIEHSRAGEILCASSGLLEHWSERLCSSVDGNLHSGKLWDLSNRATRIRRRAATSAALEKEGVTGDW
jgi:hypothetical protein